jgi:tellurite resistance protein TerC
MQAWIWAGFVVLVLVITVIDLFFVGTVVEGPHGRGKIVRPRTAILWTLACVMLALGFAPVIYWLYSNHIAGIGVQTGADGEIIKVGGRHAVEMFLTGWLLEYSLSVDNLFVFTVVFAHFRVPLENQHRVLAIGIVSALVLRGIMIASGAWLFGNFHWLLYVAGGFLIFTAWHMIRKQDKDPDFENSFAARIAKKVFPLEPRLHGDRFFVRRPDGVLAMTPMLIVLAVIDMTDVIFAIDSIPAIFGVTTDPFLVFTSNLFAIMGLRSLYFAIADFMGKFDRLKYALAFILAFIGVKMLLGAGEDISLLYNRLFKPATPLELPHVHVPSWFSLCIIVAALGVGVAASIMMKPKAESPSGG